MNIWLRFFAWLKAYVREGGAAAHIQAGVAVAAIVLAYKTIDSWKDQEVAKKRSELAYEILRRVGALEKGYSSDLWYDWGTYDPQEETYDEFLKRIADSAERRRSDLLKTPMDELEILAGPAHITFKNYKLDIAIEAVIESTRAAKSCFDSLGVAAKAPLAARSAKWQADVSATAKGLNFAREGAKDSVKGNNCGDTAQDLANTQKIKAMLMPELEFTGRLEEAVPKRWKAKD